VAFAKLRSTDGRRRRLSRCLLSAPWQRLLRLGVLSNGVEYGRQMGQVLRIQIMLAASHINSHSLQLQACLDLTQPTIGN